MPPMPPPDSRIYLDPMTLNESNLPVIVCCDDRRSLIGWGIKWHTNGDYNHAFIMHKPGMCVSQDFAGFREKSISLYLVPGQMLKFWRPKNMSVYAKQMVQKAIAARLALPWWRRSYDFIGTFIGQAINQKWIHSPFQVFCSEEVNEDFIKVDPTCAVNIPLVEPSPSELNAALVARSDFMECLGYWWND